MLHRVMTSGATALDLSFGELTTTPNPQYQQRKIDFCGQNGLFPEIDIFSTKADNCCCCCYYYAIVHNIICDQCQFQQLINSKIYVFVQNRMCHALDFIQYMLLTECRNFARKYCSIINTPFTQKTDYQWKKLPQNNNTTVKKMLVKKYRVLKKIVFILKFSIRENFFSQKAFLNQYTVILISFPSGVYIDEVVSN